MRVAGGRARSGAVRPVLGRASPCAGRVPVSVVVPALDEAANLAACLESVAAAREVVVVDGGSRDETLALAARLGARVIRRPGGTIASQRNAGIRSARCDWVLSIDADERASPELMESVRRAVESGAHDAYAVRRRNFLWGREIRYGGWGSDWVVRLARRECLYDGRRVHETLQQTGSVGRLGGALLHEPYRDRRELRRKVRRYAAWAAADLRDREGRGGVLHMLFRPPLRWFRMFVVQLGFLDGRRGLLLSLAAARVVFEKYRLARGGLPRSVRSPRGASDRPPTGP